MQWEIRERISKAKTPRKECVWEEGSRRSKKWITERDKFSESTGYGRYNEIMFDSKDKGNEATTRISPR